MRPRIFYLLADLLALSAFVLFIFSAIFRHSFAENLCVNCTGNCNGSSGLCANHCITNHYGPKCEYQCYDCKDGCDKITGKCFECPYESYGDYCNRSCNAGCRGCNRTTGVCNGCYLGYYGKFCNNCPANCPINCNEQGYCKTCNGPYWGRKCENSCPENCRRGCRIVSGKCRNCIPSYRGDLCNIRCNYANCKRCYFANGDEVCDRCVTGFYGHRCEKNCSVTCLYKSCSRVSGGCGGSCKEGWFGNQCENKCYDNCAKCFDKTTCIECMEGFYGDHCENKCRPGCKKCDRDGHDCLVCVEQSVHPWRSPNCNCTQNECLPNKYSCSKCKEPSWFTTDHECCQCQSRHCAYGSENQSLCGINGDAKCNGACRPGYYGEYCDLPCNPHCGGILNPCEKDTGNCIKQCETGWYGARCQVHCKYHYPHCTRCRTYRRGAALAVKCVDCEKGYRLNSYYYSKKCEKCNHCANNVCDVENGQCLEGCEKGYYYDYSKRCSLSCRNCIGEECHLNGTCLVPACKPGFYFDACSLKCPHTCFKDECDIATGDCHLGCIPGFYGRKCNDKCLNCRDDLCNRTTGKCFECNTSFWGVNCEHPCTGCIDEVCTHPDGCRHGCKPGLYSKFCNVKCSDQCSACDQFTGKCTFCDDDNTNTCIDSQRLPWIVSLSNLPSNGSCASGLFGPECDLPCPLGCSRNENQTAVCDRYTGTCLFIGCMSGVHGMYCEKKCSCARTPQNTPSCDRITGHCISCDIGRYGINCENNCKENCLDKLCFQHSGYCILGCKKGWTGDKCEKKIKKPEDSTLGDTVLAATLPSLGILTLTGIIIYCNFRLGGRRYQAAATDNYML